MRPGLRFHHVGIPTEERHAGEEYVERFRMYTCGYGSSPFGVEWMRFEEDCPLPELVRKVAHVAFVVDDLEAVLAGKEVLIPPNSPTAGVRVAFIVDHGAPIEFLQFDRPEAEIWPHEAKFGIT